jgi:hypothetical protein
MLELYYCSETHISAVSRQGDVNKRFEETILQAVEVLNKSNTTPKSLAGC